MKEEEKYQAIACSLMLPSFLRLVKIRSLHITNFYILNLPIELVIINGQSSETLEINAGFLQGSHLNPTVFLLYINDLLRYILRSSVNIYADDTAVYWCTSQNLDDQGLAVDDSKSSMRKKLACDIQYLMITMETLNFLQS